MKINFTGRGYEPSESIKKSIEEKVDKMSKYLADITEANVVFSVQKYRHTAEIILQGKSFSLTGTEETDDMYTSVQKVLDKIERQARKHRTKIIDRKRKKNPRPAKHLTTPDESEEAEDSDEGSPRVVRMDGYDVKPMPLDEAVMQMEISSRDFLVFHETSTENVNVLFWRKDGNLGLIELKP
ncbi:ribosome hibernation-promoting factor, HPF/YfiA family [Acidobacteriota bacterium]